MSAPSTAVATGLYSVISSQGPLLIQNKSYRTLFLPDEESDMYSVKHWRRKAGAVEQQWYSIIGIFRAWRGNIYLGYKKKSPNNFYFLNNRTNDVFQNYYIVDNFTLANHRDPLLFTMTSPTTENATNNDSTTA